MAAEQFNIGKDLSISIVGPTGPLEPLGLLKEFEPRPISRVLKSMPINKGGRSVHRTTREGWEGHLMFDRENINLDLLEDALEQNYYAGNPDIFFQITETVRNFDGTTDQFIYIDCVLRLETGGRFRTEEIVEQRVAFSCSGRIAG